MPLPVLAIVGRVAARAVSNVISSVLKSGKRKKSAGESNKKPKKVKPKLVFYMEPHEQARLVHDVQLEMMDNIKKQLRQDDKNFTYSLSESVKTGYDSGTYTVEVDSPYGYFVEYGVPPGSRLNFDALFMWVQYKLGILDPKMAKTVTFKIFHKIINEGIAPSQFFKKAILRFRQKNKLLAQRVRKPRKKRRKSRIKMVKRSMKRSKRKLKRLNKDMQRMARVVNRYS